jgi:hypothetical protein
MALATDYSDLDRAIGPERISNWYSIRYETVGLGFEGETAY